MNVLGFIWNNKIKKSTALQCFIQKALDKYDAEYSNLNTSKSIERNDEKVEYGNHIDFENIERICFDSILNEINNCPMIVGKYNGMCLEILWELLSFPDRKMLTVK